MGNITPDHEWGIEVSAAATVQATVARAADAGGRHVCKSITASIATGATASGVEEVQLLDGATVLWSCLLSAPANGTANISVSNLNLIGTKNTAMTIAFVAGGAATSQESVAISGYTCKENFVGV